jgi:hypothetical protein
MSFSDLLLSGSLARFRQFVMRSCYSPGSLAPLARALGVYAEPLVDPPRFRVAENDGLEPALVGVEIPVRQLAMGLEAG